MARKQYENSPADIAEDRRGAGLLNITPKQYENTARDRAEVSCTVTANPTGGSLSRTGSGVRLSQAQSGRITRAAQCAAPAGCWHPRASGLLDRVGVVQRSGRAVDEIIASA
jgi:hypothetical protein